MSMYNDASHAKLAINSCLNQKNIEGIDIRIVVVDDGSDNGSFEEIDSAYKEEKAVELHRIEHGERGIARAYAFKKAYEGEVDYLIIIDSDMKLKEDLVATAIKRSVENQIESFVVPEIPYSNSNNFYTKVKIFERQVLNDAGENLDESSIEAARFWSRTAYDISGGIDPNQIAFEEIQPTIRYREKGGKVMRLIGTGLFHDEKHVTLHSILKKKYYYFKQMNKTLKAEESGDKKAFKRWYFFRPVLYRKDNLKKYLRHPLLFLGMVWMYILLTITAVIALLKTRALNASNGKKKTA